MNREIKFRAWEKALEEMIPVHQVDFEKGMINTSSAWRFFKEVELMQFTGLHDKNGVDIYEGDILKELSTHPLLVSVQQGHAYITFFDFGCEFAELLFQREIDEMEIVVVGNKFENPNLLEESK